DAASSAIAGIDWARPFERGRSHCICAGTLALDSRQVVATDPLVNIGIDPLEDRPSVTQGEVILVQEEIEDWGERITFALLRLTPERPVRWRESGGYFVDSGTGCFVDAQVVESIVPRDDNMLDQMEDAERRW